MQTTPRARVQALRQAMAAERIDACLVPSADPHLSEYLPARWQGRRWLSGFTGSVGTFVATADFAGVWVDGRYWAQAEAELAGSGIELMKVHGGAGQAHIDWLGEHLKAGQTVGVDGATLGLAAARTLQAALDARAIALRTDCDLLAEVWPDRPPLPRQPVFEHLAPHAAAARADKLASLRAEMQRQGAEWHLISTLDDIAWLFNLRGSDVSFNPVFLAHALVGVQGAALFVGAGKIGPELQAALAADGVELRDYEGAGAALAALPEDCAVLLDPRRVTLGLRQALPAGARLVEAVNPTTLAKSRKSAAEADQVRAVMEQDGAALCEFFAWFEAAQGRERITELTIAERVEAARARRAEYVSPSFATIAGFNANGALPHYRATTAAHAVIEGDGLLLIDSGGQYLGGTTDITRVAPVGTPSAEQRRDFTLVLKGMMALSRARFPRGTKGPMLDAIARAPLWAEGIDYGHGTGHGVGYFLNVHEGPQVISCYAQPEPHTAMEPGMITSIEPGVYRPGKWGVRIENLVLNVEAGGGEFGEFLEFETLTLCPIDTRCIERGLLRADEVEWLDDYHATVRRRLLPHVEGAARTWLEQRTAPLV
jgi:Xaa-Pro aminopeptidase